MNAQIVSAENLSPIAWNQAPVITTELLAQLYDTDPVRIRQNHDRNTERFIEGKHFFKLEGDDLRDFKRRVSESYSVKIARNVNSLMLWTERGAARHAKMLDTEQAWEVFEKLEDHYFKATPRNALHQLPDVITPEQQNALQQIIKRLAGDDGRKVAGLWSRFNNHFKLGSYKQLPSTRFAEAVSYLEGLSTEQQSHTPAKPNILDMNLLEIQRQTHEWFETCNKAFEDAGIQRPAWPEFDEERLCFGVFAQMLQGARVVFSFDHKFHARAAMVPSNCRIMSDDEIAKRIPYVTEEQAFTIMAACMERIRNGGPFSKKLSR